MSSFYDDASLVVIPSGYKTSKVYAEKPTDGSGDLTFTRTGDTATRVNSAGVIEKVRTNYARQSQSFATAAAWTATNGTLTNNAGTAPDGTNTASKIVATNTDPFCYQSITLTGPVVASCYLKAVGSAIGKSAEIRAGVSLTAFTLSGSWQRVSVTHTASAAHNYGLEVPNPGVIGDEVLLWGFQVETGDVATDYIPTTTAAVSVGPVANVPRLDYLGSSCGKLLLEPQRTNLLTYSEQLNTGSGGTSVVTANTQVSPDGYTNADTIGTGYWTKSTSQAAGTYTLSVFAKYQSAASFLLYIYDGAYYQGSFNLQTGVATTSTGSPAVSMVNYGNGWYRCIVTVTTASTVSEVGFGSGNFYGYGLQLEAGAYATSYIPTLAASATRGADACSKTGISSLIGQTEGVAFIDFVWNGLTGVGSYPRIIELATDANNIIQLYSIAGTTSWGWDIFNGGVVQFTGSSTMALGRNKIAIGYKLNDMVVYKNGTLLASDTSCTVPATSALGVTGIFNGAGGAQLAASVNQTLLFKTRLTNAELATLTTL